MNPFFKKFFSRLLIFFIVLLALFFIFRNPLLHWGISRVEVVIKQRTGATLEIGESSFSGIFSVSMHNISLVPDKGDTLLNADTLNVRISLWTLFLGTIRVKQLYSTGVHCTISCRNSVCNYSGFLQEKRTSTVVAERNYSLTIKRMLDRVFNLAPQRSILKDVFINYRNDTLERKLKITEFHSDEDSITGTAEDGLSHTTWKCNGRFSQIRHSLELNVYPVNGGYTFLPVLSELFGLAMSFDTMHVGVDGYKKSGDLFTLNGTFSVKQLIAYHKKISDDTVKVASASFNFLFRSGKTFLEIDSSSVASLGAINFSPYLHYSGGKEKEYSLNITTDKTKCNDFFSSLPQGMFDEVRDLEADGTLQFKLNFKINTSRPDSLLFESSFKKEKFRFRKYGSVNLMKLNEEFSHSVYEHDRYVRSFMVGPSNSFFSVLDSISPSFINSVLTSEDGNFFFHNGFNEDAFRKSIITNFKAGKFVRGGSTISMQLVKNVFLNRKKTIARKAEEVLLVWLIENNRLCSKERMLEVYLNIIELGPDVYGIGEASAFYFKKKPIELTLPEGIFLASLLPHPKWFKYSFDTLGNLKPYLADYYRIVSDFMLKKNLITQNEHDQLQPRVVLTGPAREMVIPSDTIPEDEIED